MVALKKDIVTTSPTPLAIIQQVIEKGGDIGQLEKLMDMQERFEDRQAKKAFDRALAEFKTTPLAIEKDSHVKYKTAKGGIVDYKHATLANILNIVTPALSKSGLSLSWRTAIEGNFIKVTAVLSHDMGHSEDTWLTATGDSTGSKNALQAVGSTISYLQRYTAMAILGITSGDIDDDGNRGGDVDTPKDKGYEPPAEDIVEETYLDRCLAYVDGFCDKTLDEFLVMRESKLEAAYKSLSNDQERHKLKSMVNQVEQLLLEKGGDKK